MPPKNLRSGSRTGNVDQQNPTETENPGNPSEIDLTQLQNLLATLNDALEREKEERTRERQEFLDAINELRNTRQPPGDNGQRTGNGAHGDKRRINVSGLDKLSGDISLQDFVAWRCTWRDFCRLERLETYLVEEQAAALRLVLSTQMAQTVQMVLGISSTDDMSPDLILDRIYKHLREKRSVALDRVEFEQCRQTSGESFDDFHIRLQRIAGCASLCNACYEERLTTRIICGINNQEARKKLLQKINSHSYRRPSTYADQKNRHPTMSPYFSAPQMSITLKIKAGAGHEAAAEAAAESAPPRTQRERPKTTPLAQNVVTRPISPAKPAPPRARIATSVERRIISPPCANPRSQEKTPVTIKESIT